MMRSPIERGRGGGPCRPRSGPAPSRVSGDRATPRFPTTAFELEVVPGLEEIAEREARERLGPDVELRGRVGEGRVALAFDGDARRLDALRTVVAVYAVATFDVPRPKALLGHAQLTRLLALVRGVLDLHPSGAFGSFRLSAAGSDSAVFARLRAEIAANFGLESVVEGANLLVAVRRAPGPVEGWQALVRLGPRPLSARPWRVCNLPGALNATVAQAMVRLARPRPSERVLNLACGSGTLMIERLTVGPARLVVGNDVDPAALDCARANLQASGYASAATLLRVDAARLPFPAASFDTIVVDLPFGMLVGSARENERLYPALLAEATRVAAPGAAFIAITERKRLFETTLRDVANHWTTRAVIPIKVPFRSGYLQPNVYHLQRS